MKNSLKQAFKCYTECGGFEDVLHVAPTFDVGGCLRYKYKGLGGCVEKKEERSSAIENTGVELRSLVLISDAVYNMSMNKSFHILMSFVCSRPSLK